MSFKPPTSRLVVSLLSLAMLAGWAFYFFGLEPFLEAAYAGTSWEYFNDHAARWRLRHPDPSLRTFVQEATGLFFRLGSLATGIAAVGISFWMVAPRRIRTFLNAETSPFNLAFFRIVLFGYLLTVDVGQAAWFARLPDVLQVPPPGWESIVPVLPTDPGVVSTAGILFKAVCLTGLVGCWSRTSAAVVAVLGLYVLGLPQFYGKINHNHHLLWFSGLLATSRCGDALALDAVWTAWKHPAASVPTAHRRYAQPLRYMWVLLGIMYFFPGFWKLANEGLTWALSDNLKFRMHHLWFGLDDFTPLFRLDRYPLLYQAGGLATIAFEISFVFSLPFRTLRHLAMGAALLFHQATAWFLAIYFASLPPFLLLLVDWAHVWKRAGRRFLAQPLTLVYDAASDWEPRVARMLTTLDVLDRIRITSDPSVAPPCMLLSGASPSPALFCNGYLRPKAALRLLRFLPAAFFLLPAFVVAAFFPMVHMIPAPGNRKKPFALLPSRALHAVGGLLIGVNVLFGFLHLHSWPFSVYPTFAVQMDSTITTLRLETIDADGATSPVVLGKGNAMEAGFSPERLRGLVQTILGNADTSVQREQLRALWTVWTTHGPEPPPTASCLRVSRATFRTDPSLNDAPPIRESLLLTLRLSPEGQCFE